MKFKNCVIDLTVGGVMFITTIREKCGVNLIKAKLQIDSTNTGTVFTFIKSHSKKVLIIIY